TGLYATHTFVPPTPGPIAAAGNLGLGSSLGLVILVGLPLAFVTAMAGMLWATRFIDRDIGLEQDGAPLIDGDGYQAMGQCCGELPRPLRAFAPIFVPILPIGLGTIAALPGRPLGEGALYSVIAFLGEPIFALAVGLALACTLLKPDDKRQEF